MSAKIPPKAASKDVIYVDVDDEITSIIDKVENSENKVVALVLPKRAASLQSIVNMKLLARSAKTAGKNPVLITSEGALLPLAGAAGLHVAKNLQSKPEIPAAPLAAAKSATDMPAEELPEGTDSDEPDEEELPDKIDYANAASIGALAAAHEAENPETIDLDDEDASDEPAPKDTKTPKDKKNKVPDFDRFRMLLGLGALAFIGLVTFLILAIFVLPKATVTLKTTSEPVSASFIVTANAATPALDSQKAVMPAKLESTDQTGTQSVTATGQQNNGTKATGTVTFSAGTCGPTFPSDIPSGTGVSASGAAFITQENASFTAKNSGGHCTFQSSATDITAQSAGAKYNVNSDSFSVAGHSGVSGSGSTSGGTDNIVTVLSQSDVEGAKAKLTTGATADEFTKAFEKKLSDQGGYVLSSTLKAGDPVVTATPAVGQPASTATVTIKTTYTVLTIKKSDLSQAIENKLSSQVDKTKQKLNSDFLEGATVTVQSQPAPNAATLSISEDTTAVPIINIASVKKQVKGKKTGDIKAAIGNWPGVKDVDVKLSPFWVSKVPAKDSKVKVILVEVKPSTDNSEQP